MNILDNIQLHNIKECQVSTQETTFLPFVEYLEHVQWERGECRCSRVGGITALIYFSAPSLFVRANPDYFKSLKYEVLHN